MKTIYNTILFTCLSLGAAAQVTENIFSFEQGQPWDITTYPDLTPLYHNVTDNQVTPAKIKIPFPFVFNRTLCDSVGISENGFIWFGAAQAGEMQNITNPVSAVLPASVFGIASAMGTDLHPRTGGVATSIATGTTGTGDMKELIIEWRNTSRAVAVQSGTGEDTITFQIKLYQFMNRIEFAYIKSGLNTSFTTTCQVGLRSNIPGDFNTRMTDASHNWFNSLKGVSSTSTCELSALRAPRFGDMLVWHDTRTVGLKEGADEFVTVYPVPATDELFIQSSNGVVLQSYELYSTDGRLVARGKYTGTAISISPLLPGMYLLQIQTNEGVLRKNIVKN